ncbi:MAG: hypothetical protein C0413_00755 [Clostridiales bacterium]|nr:hypothetical protein [Clostridiales bacterium]
MRFKKQQTTNSGTQPDAIELPTNQQKQNKAILIVLMFLPCLVVNLQLDNDIWFLLNSGRYVLQHGIPTIEPFSMHQGFSFLMQQWLSATIFWSIYSKLGAVGVIVLLLVVYAAIVFVVYRLTSLISENNLAATFLATLFTASALKPVMFTRPMIFTMLILLCELYVVERFIRSGKAAFLIPLPILSVLQINLHAAMWPMQFVILLPYMIDSFRFKLFFLEGQGFAKRYFFPAVGLMFAAGFLNPYGLDAMTYVFRSYGFAEIGMVLEMMAPDINNGSGKFIFGVFILLLAIYMLKRKRSTRLRYALLPLGTAILALSSARSFALFAACGIFPLAYFLRDVVIPEGKIKSEKNVFRLRAFLIALVVLAAGGLFVQRVFKAVQAGESPAVSQAMDYLVEQEEKDGMVLYTGYNDGGYAEFLGFKPYIDPRAEVFVKKNNQKADVMKEYHDLQLGELYYKDVLEKYGFTHLLISIGDILITYLPHDDTYEKIYEDDIYQIYRLKAGAD